MQISLSTYIVIMNISSVCYLVVYLFANPTLLFGNMLILLEDNLEEVCEGQCYLNTFFIHYV
jgi:hypothetical protein